MFPIQELPRTDGGTHQRLLSESFFDQACVTNVATLSFMDRQDPERITEWRAYWFAFGYPPPPIGDRDVDGWQDARVNTCAARGSKLPEEVARAIFDIKGPYNH